MKRKILFLSVLILLTSCLNKELDRNLASELISNFYEYPNVETIYFRGIVSSNTLNNELKDLRSSKLITHKRRGRYGDEFFAIPINKGLNYVVSGKGGYDGYRIVSNLRKLNEVTGIRFNEGKNTAYVDFNTKRFDITPFGESKGYKEGDLNDYSVTMQLYDDGWRITDKKIKNLKKADLPSLFPSKEQVSFFRSLNNSLSTKNKNKFLNLIEFPIFEMNGNNIGDKISREDFERRFNRFLQLNFKEEVIISKNSESKDLYSNFQKGTILYTKYADGIVNDEEQCFVALYILSSKNKNRIFGFNSQCLMIEGYDDYTEETTSNSNNSKYQITVDNLRVRNSPNLNGEKIENLPINTFVEFLGEKSTNQTTVTIKNNDITEYWYKIKTPSGNIGWIHGCCFDK